METPKPKVNIELKNQQEKNQLSKLLIIGK